MGGTESLPWRGPGPDRPDLPLPPDRLPMRRAGRMLKRWRYVAAFCDELFVCAARVQAGFMGQTFWAALDRRTGELHESTRTRFPIARGEVWTEHPEGEGAAEHAADEGSTVRIEAEGVKGFLRLGGGTWVEAVCPVEGDDAYVWTRKRAPVPVEVDLRIGERRWQVEGQGVEDESAGYHPRHTVWSWSAGVGETSDGRSLGWNLVSGINDPPERSERAIWVAGQPMEPGPVTFDEDLGGIGFDDGSRLEFTPEGERNRSENRLVVRYTYRQPFGSFEGRLPGGIEVGHALGVMEFHDAVW